VKTTMLTAAAMGGLALAGSAPLKVPVKAGRALAFGCVVAAGLGLLFWRGSVRTLELWGHAVVAESQDERASELRWLDLEARGLSYSRSPDPGRVERALEKAEELDLRSAPAAALEALGSGDAPRVSRAFRGIADEARAEERKALDKAWKFRRAYLRAEPGDEGEVKRLGELSIRLERAAPGTDFSRAVEEAFLKLTERSPDSFVGWTLMGHLRRRKGHMTEAAGFYEQAARRYPLNPELWLFLGDARTSFDPKGARDAYARALEVNRVVEDYSTMLFAKLWQSAPVRPRSARLLAELERAEAELGPTAEVSFRRGLVVLSAASFEEAANEFTRALELEPRDVQLALFRALALEMNASRLGAAASGDDAKEQAARAAKVLVRAAWDRVDELQESAAPGFRLPEFTLSLVRSRLVDVRAVARRPSP
jgi:tetratricopeptide (TPR) repeat protein